MAQTSRHISIGKSPDFLMSRGEIEINHQAVLKVYRVERGSLELLDTKTPFDRSLAVVIEQLKQYLTAYGWSDDSSVTCNEKTQDVVIIVTGNLILSLIYKLEPQLTKNQAKDLTNEFKRVFKRDSPKK